MTSMPPERTESDAVFANRLSIEYQKLHQQNQLTAAEIEAVRKLIETDRFWSRVGSTLKTWAVSIAAVIAGGTVGLDALKKLIQGLGGK